MRCVLQDLSECVQFIQLILATTLGMYKRLYTT